MRRRGASKAIAIAKPPARYWMVLFVPCLQYTPPQQSPKKPMKSPLSTAPASNKGQENIMPETMKRIEPTMPKTPMATKVVFPSRALRTFASARKTDAYTNAPTKNVKTVAISGR